MIYTYYARLVPHDLRHKIKKHTLDIIPLLNLRDHPIKLHIKHSGAIKSGPKHCFGCCLWWPKTGDIRLFSVDWIDIGRIEKWPPHFSNFACLETITHELIHAEQVINRQKTYENGVHNRTLSIMTKLYGHPYLETIL